jgi:tetratricopeptide (TPR) repeat protein
MRMEAEGISLETGVKLLSRFDFSVLVKTGEHPWVIPSDMPEDPAMAGQGLRLLEAITGGRSPAFALAWRFMALSKKSQGKWGEAEDDTQRALDIYHRIYGDEHVLVADGLYALAGVLGGKEEWEEAEDNYRRCLQMRRKLLGEAHPDVACALMGVGWVRKEQARFTEAERSLRDALAILRQLHGSEEWFATLMAEIWLGEVLQKQGRHDEADQLAREAREVRGCLPCSQHDGCLDYFTRMGFALIFQDRGTDAEAYCREALALTRKLRGDEHPDVAMSLLMLGAMLYEEGEYSAVQPLLRESLRLDPGDDWIRSGLAELLYKTGDMEGAAQCRSEIIRRALAGEDATALNDASWQVVRHPHWDPALYALALRAAQAADSAEPDNGFILNTLGVAQYRAGKFEEALATLTRSDELNGGIPADVAFLAMALHQLGRTDETQAALRRLRVLMKDAQHAHDEEAQAFSHEAETLIAGGADAAAEESQPADAS